MLDEFMTTMNAIDCTVRVNEDVPLSAHCQRGLEISQNPTAADKQAGEQKRCSAVFEKVDTSGKRWLHFLPVPPKVRPLAPQEGP